MKPSFSRRHLLKLTAAAGLLVHSRSAVQAAESSPAPAPAAGAQPGGVYRFRIGDLEAMALHDGSYAVPKVQPLFAPEGKPEDVEKALRDAFFPTDRVDLEFNILLVKMGAETILVDTGYGAGSGPTTGRLLAHLAAAGLQPADITGIFLSHGHGDHFGGLLSKGTTDLVFPNAKIFTSRTEAEFWTGSSPEKFPGISAEARKNAADTFRSIQPKLQLIQPGDKILDGLEIIDAHGHTPGHLNFLFSNSGEQLLHFVDCAHHAILMFGHPEWTVGFDVENRVAVETRRKIFSRAAGERLRCFSYHLPWPGLGHIRSENSAFEWVPEPWKFTA